MDRLRILCFLTLFAVLAAGCAGMQKKKDQKQTESAEFHYKMAAAYFQSHEIPLAIKEATECLQMNPNHKLAHYLMAIIYQGRHDYAKAVDHYKKVLEIDPKYDFARNNLGTVYLAMERWQDAEAEFKQLLEEPLYPTPELAQNNLGWALYNEHHYDAALQHFKMATFLKPQLCVAHNNMGLAYQKLGNTDEAMHSFESAIHHCPRNYAEPHFHIGKMLAASGNPEARKQFQACARIEPETNLGRRCREYLAAVR